MRTVYLIIGIVILVFTIIDLIWTTLWVDGGAGPLSGRLSAGLWNGMRKLTKDRDRSLSLAGPIILVITLLFWVFMMWIGWTFIFSFEPDSISSTMNDQPIVWYERLYFVGYSLFTLGNGNYAPKEGIWQIVSTLVSGGGMLFLTLGASYIISVIDAVVKKRSFSTTITGISKKPARIIQTSWDGNDFNRLDLLLLDLTSDLSSITQQHNAYPLLHYYHSNKPEQSGAVAIALLDETLTIMEYGVDEQARPNPILLKSIRESISTYLETLDFARIASSDKIPPSPDLNPLKETGVPMVSQEEFDEKVVSLEDRRKKLAGLIEANGRDWPL